VPERTSLPVFGGGKGVGKPGAMFERRITSPADVVELRSAVEEVARAHGLSPEATFDLKVATGEALANAVRHGASGPFEVDVALESDANAIQVEVLDRNHFRVVNALDPERGRGLPLMIALADEVEFAAGEDGTRVRIRMRVGHAEG
jgi:anti-sigma regulatory factor (Ser/Thr protein kinase)